MNDRQQAPDKHPQDPATDWVAANKHLKWPLIIILIIIVVILILMDLYYPAK